MLVSSRFIRRTIFSLLAALSIQFHHCHTAAACDKINAQFQKAMSRQISVLRSKTGPRNGTDFRSQKGSHKKNCAALIKENAFQKRPRFWSNLQQKNACSSKQKNARTHLALQFFRWWCDVSSESTNPSFPAQAPPTRQISFGAG